MQRAAQVFSYLGFRRQLGKVQGPESVFGELVRRSIASLTHPSLSTWVVAVMKQIWGSLAKGGGGLRREPRHEGTVFQSMQVF